MWLFVCQVHPEWRVRLTASWSFATLISFIQIWLAFSRNCLPKINACDLFHEVTQASSNSPDLNRCTLKDMRRDFHQFITCPTRHNETLDLCYVKVKGTYKIHLPSRIWVPVTIIACVLYRTVQRQSAEWKFGMRMPVWVCRVALRLQIGTCLKSPLLTWMSS